MTQGTIDYPYLEVPARADILRMIPTDGHMIGSFGCGAGNTEHELVLQGREVHGVDIATESIAASTPKMTSARLISPDDVHPFAENSLDGLILADVIEHLPLAWLALREIVKAVKPGGWVVISVPNMRNIDVLKQFFWKGDWPENPIGIFDQTHIQVMSDRRLERWCREAGLRIERKFDKYDPFGPRRYAFFRTLDLVTFKLFHSWFMYQLQFLCRKL
jgi:2-polyprenyl-3-methyl-5-hydroxy-6-metoxy-1,4-benzoquinol methylase